MTFSSDVFLSLTQWQDKADMGLSFADLNDPTTVSSCLEGQLPELYLMVLPLS